MMIKAIGCVLHQHDLRLVALAAFICFLSCLTASALLSRARAAEGWLRTTWIAIAGLEFGGGVWSLHFIAMLAFMPGLAISFDLEETGWSVVIAIVGAFAAFGIGASRLPLVPRVIGAGFLLTSSIGGMHYVGITAMRLQGRIDFDHQQVVLSVLASGLFACAAVCAMSRLQSLAHQLLLTLLLCLAICLLHFTGMSAMTLHLGLGPENQAGLVGSATLAVAVGAVTLALLLISLSLSIMDRHLSDRSANEAMRLREIAHHDPLTGLANRALLEIELNQALDHAREDGSTAAILCLDLDRFKVVNDLLGHAAGDELLVEVAERIARLVRRSDVVARLGGDEFVIVMRDAGDPGGCALLAERMAQAVGEPFIFQDQQMTVGLSVGIAFFPKDGTTGSELLRCADIALYRAKDEKCGSVRMFAPAMDEELQNRRTLERDLRTAVALQSLEVYYQPLVDCGNGMVEGFEALLRWRHPTRGMVSPTEFIPIAEESGLIIPLGQWVLGQACMTASRWEGSLRVAVNLSPTQFKQSDLIEQIFSVLAETGLAANRLELEVTEGVLIDNPERAVATLSELRTRGVRVSLDDFGTGFSSLSYLRMFPLDKIKIDRSFITNLGRDEKSSAIVRSIVMLAHSLDLSVTAEGVETAEQLANLQTHSCNQVQGYLLGRPAALQDLAIPSHQASAPSREEKLEVRMPV